MKTFAKYEIVGRVGQLKEGNGVLRITIAAEYGRKDNNGDFQSKPFWNEVNIWNENVAKWAKENVVPGDLVRSEGTIRQEQWEDPTTGETRYGVSLSSESFDNYSNAIRRQMARQAG
ncbi:single-stranded DNA-binding protein (plasmid) [Phaeobacter inhibens]|uniref:Single-stranded DNA-binding protein n=1 Tax=Phaeobacter inhibens TaxID=221822 RepID=A0ABN5GYI2_9RHOB|nr:single-stranded DNA-binding protein [Phaeobacter inhibens]MCA0948541.1 single-stranded DNA-binding protein [Alloyangia pacifica]AUQ56931.1 single-stranded DNA-binding protein [Phaeobacter inhibens]AUQ68907.1 single-stranded DNA-binding protein [Phaeobacter inhibens]AUQ80948.1 single-stranded DNA-binding protein [Phaeobacter inhibens]AUQ97336.1 single-stranded DNA-binding protein [Phaeobacter inhibens]